MIFGYVYSITSPFGKTYVGSKQSSEFVEDYWGSSHNPEFWNDLKKYSKENFIREVWGWYNSKKELLQAEEYYINVLCGLLSLGGYNLRLPIHFYFERTPESIKKQINKWKKYYEKLPLEEKQRMNKNRSNTLKGHSSWNNWGKNENAFGHPVWQSKMAKRAWLKHPDLMYEKAVANITKYNKSEKGINTSRKNAQHMRELKNNKTEEEKRLISLKLSLGSLKRYNYEEHKKRLDLIRIIEPDYDPNETPKQRFKKKCELLKKK